MSSGPDVPTVDATTARERVDSGAVLLDVRERDEWHVGHAADAVWIPMGDVAARHTELPTDAPVLVMCRSGNRSGVVTRALCQAGYDASNIAGGMHAWADAGFDVVRDDGGPGTVA